MSDVHESYVTELREPDNSFINFNVPPRNPDPGHMQSLTKKLGISRRSLLCIGVFLAGGIAIAGISSLISKKRSTATPRFEGLKLEPTPRSRAPSIQRNILSVDSVDDLNAITKATDSLVIETLTEEYMSAYSFQIPVQESVVSLSIRGPVGGKWLEFLFYKFPSISHLVIDMDKFSIPNEQGNLAGIDFKKVAKLHLENFKVCPKTSLMTLNRFPELKHFKMSNAELTPSSFPCIHKFLEAHGKQCQTVVYLECFICKECNFFDISYNEHTDIKILQRKLFI